MGPDTKERLQMYAWEHHASVSKAVTDMVWAAEVKNTQIRGQASLDLQHVKQEWPAKRNLP